MPFEVLPMSTECVFCKIAEKKIPARIVHDDGDVLAFHDANPQAPTHVLVIPREHVETLAAVGDDAAGSQVLARLFQGVRRVAAAIGLDADSGYRVVVNCGERAGQSVFHLHAHVLGGRWLGWPPG